MTITPLLLFLHIASVVVWVGGMFFAYVCLRPAAVAVLEPPLRLTLWQRVFARFLPLAGVAVGLVLLSGLTMLFGAGFAAAPPHWHAMFLLGLVMAAVYVGVIAVPYRLLADAVAASNWAAAGQALGSIRKLVAFNLALGFATIAVATLGRWL